MLLRQRGVTYLLSCDDNISRLGFVIRAKRVAEKIRGSPSEGVRNVSPIVAPLGKIVIDGTFGQQIVGQHIPLAATPVEIKDRIEDFPHVYLTRPPSPFALLGGWDH